MMKHKSFNAFRIFFLIIATFMQACASTPTKNPDQWPAAQNSIQIDIHADKNLNIYEGSPHVVPLCFYQLKDTNFFNKLASYPDGLNRLLECRSFHPSVARIFRVTLQPDTQKKITMDREKDVQHVAITAGYFFKDNNKINRIYNIPVKAERPALIKSTEIVKPAQLDILLKLGPEQIED